MQFDTYKSFGYPVLRTIVQGEDLSLLDYQRSNFDPSISKPMFDLRDDPDNFTVSYDLGLRVEELIEAVNNNYASMYIYALCKKTFYSNLIELKEQKGTIKFALNLFRYDIELSAFVIANKKFILNSARFHEDFGDQGFEVTKGDVLAWSQPITYSAEKDQYRSMSSVFEFAESREVPIGKYIIKTDEDQVTITMHPDFYIEVRKAETTPFGKQALLAGLFVPAVIQLLTEYKEAPELSENYKWASILAQKCRDFDLDLDNISDYGNFAQELLKMPLQKLVTLNSGN